MMFFLQKPVCLSTGTNGFESGLVVGSGFLANMALIDALVRKNDMLFMDEEYHASGMMATGLIGERVVFFQHNDSEDLRKKRCRRCLLHEWRSMQPGDL